MTQKELHIYIDTYPRNAWTTYADTLNAIKHEQAVVHTTQTHFCSTQALLNGYRLFVHEARNSIEIKLGDNDCTDRIIKEGHNLEKLYLAGEFSNRG